MTDHAYLGQDLLPAAGAADTYMTDTDPEDTDGAPRVDTLTVPPEAAGVRMDRFLSELSAYMGEARPAPRLDLCAEPPVALSRSAAVRLLESGCVTLRAAGNGCASVPDKKTRLKAGDEVTVVYPPAADYDILPENIPLDVVYEDGDIIVVNKPVGMVVHPAPGNEHGTLVSALLWHCGDSLSGVGGVKRPGIVHRIDKDTGGLLVVAKNDDAHRALAAQLKSHTVSRVYHAVCVGNLREDAGTVDLAVGRNPQDRKKMAAFPKGTAAPGVREAVTHYRVLERYPIGARWGQAFTYISCELETGRTHQIRVHMAATGHPLLGDPVYGGDGTRFGRACAVRPAGQALHAARLRLIHPRTGEPMQFECPLPPAFEALLTTLRKEADHA